MRVVLLSALPKSMVPDQEVALADEYLEKGLAVTDVVERLRAVCRRPLRSA
jgi:hypothetical protein